MARPKNMTVVKNGVVVSVTPKNLRTFLEGGALVGRTVATVDLNLDAGVDTTATLSSLRAALDTESEPVVALPTPSTADRVDTVF